MDTFIKIAPIFIAGLTALVAMWKYFYEKNRDIYEKRLNEVYAPLYGYLVAQETFRKLYIPNVEVKTAPILTSEKSIVNTQFSLSTGKVKQETRTEAGFFDRKNFIRVLNDSNKGLARPKLLLLIKQYEVLVYLEENTQEESEQWKKATEKKVDVEYELFKEIVDGYESTVRFLRLDGSENIYDLEKMKV
ncbi:hypothetical protein SY88_18370 [Clostridiales bacterium PH28_bin88]|nr:hypothetical protein SY88_18370 [Clostridiales bacterium PH28_bin88]